MHRLILQLSAALLTFAIGIAVSAIYSMSGVTCIGEPTRPVEAPVPQVEVSCYPGISIPTPSIGKD